MTKPRPSADLTSRARAADEASAAPLARSTRQLHLQRQGDVAIPACPRARLVLIQPSFPFQSFKSGFNNPSDTRNSYPLSELGVLRGEDDVICEFLGVV